MYTTASSKPGLLRNPLFDDWDAIPEPTQWDHTTANATYTRLRKTDPLTANTRTIFAPGIRRSDADYIYAGEDGFRITMAAAAAADDWIVRQDVAGAASLTARPIQHASVRVTSRCSVENNILRVQVIGLLAAVDTFYLSPRGGTYFPGRTGFEWIQTETNIPLTMKTLWTTWGLEVPMFPLGIDTVAVRFANGSTGAQVIDIGEVDMLENLAEMGGAA
jgi:hypothetical protein